MSNPSCLQTGAAGQVHDAVIIAVVSIAERTVMRQDAGLQPRERALHSAQPARERRGCADEGAPRRWGERERV